MSTAPEELITHLFPPGPKDKRYHRPPWTWHALEPAERATLDELVDNWVHTYNRTLTTAVAELVPPCWRQHQGLATELPVILWHWYAVHRSQNAQVTAASEFYARILPGFRGRVEKYLGDAAEDCRSGRHPDHPENWRQALDKVIDGWPPMAADDEPDVLAELHCGFGPAS